MSDVRRLLARLNPTTVRYDVGNGGLPQLTAQDIAAAVAFVSDELGREVLLHCWWPDGARLTARELDAIIARYMYVELGQRQRARKIAELEAHIAADAVASVRSPTRAERDALTRAQNLLERAKEDEWPVDPAVYLRIIQAVLNEVRSSHLCPTCGGTGAVPNPLPEAPPVTCAECAGQGTVKISDRARAKESEIDNRNYARRWKQVYEWTFRLVSDAEVAAVRALRKALK